MAIFLLIPICDNKSTRSSFEGVRNWVFSCTHIILPPYMSNHFAITHHTYCSQKGIQTWSNCVLVIRYRWLEVWVMNSFSWLFEPVTGQSTQYLIMCVSTPHPPPNIKQLSFNDLGCFCASMVSGTPNTAKVSVPSHPPWSLVRTSTLSLELNVHGKVEKSMSSLFWVLSLRLEFCPPSCTKLHKTKLHRVWPALSTAEFGSTRHFFMSFTLLWCSRITLQRRDKTSSNTEKRSLYHLSCVIVIVVSRSGLVDLYAGLSVIISL